MSASKKEAPASIPDDSALDAQIDRFEARRRERERIEKIRSAGNLATEELLLVRVGQPVPVANILRPSEHVLPDDAVKIPGGAILWPDAAVRIPVGFVRPDMGAKSDGDPVLLRHARRDEVEKGVTVQLAAGYLEMKGRADAAASLRKDALAESERRDAVVEKAKKALADAEKAAEDGKKIVASAERHADGEQAAFEKWVANCGRPADAVRAAAEQMMRQPEKDSNGGYIIIGRGAGEFERRTASS